jgi:lysophospholipase L1-like esterase
MYDFSPVQSSDTVFLGDSLTESFDLMQFFGRTDLRNYGISGNTSGHLLHRLDVILDARPLKLFLMIGVNDLYQGIDVEEVFSNITTILDRFNTETPETGLFVQSTLPVNDASLFLEDSLNPVIIELNTMLKDHCLIKNLNFIDLHSKFLDENGQLDSRYTNDGVHLTQQGYMLWSELINVYLR